MSREIYLFSLLIVTHMKEEDDLLICFTPLPNYLQRHTNITLIHKTCSCTALLRMSRVCSFIGFQARTLLERYNTWAYNILI